MKASKATVLRKVGSRKKHFEKRMLAKAQVIPDPGNLRDLCQPLSLVLLNM